MSVLILSKSSKAYAIKRLVEAFRHAGIDVKVCNPDKFDVVVGTGRKSGLHYDGEALTLPDLVLTRTGSGTTSFISSIIKQFEQEGVPCINSSSSIELAMDKLGSMQLFASNNLPIPNTMLVRHPVDIEIADRNIGWPCIVKVITGSHGDGIYLCENKRAFKKIMEFIDKLNSTKELIVQEYVDTRPGEDLRVLVLGDTVIGAMRRFAPAGDFRANISNGGTGELFEVTSEIDYLAREAARICGLEIAGIDLLFDKDGYKICEANSAPGFEGFEKYCGVDVAGQIAEYIKYKISLSGRK